MRSHKFANIPTVGAVLAIIDQAESQHFQLEAEEMWQKVLKCAKWERGYDKLDPATQHAVRAAGGFSYLCECPSEEDMQWAKKRFLADYVLVHETRENDLLLTAGAAKDIIKELEADNKPLNWEPPGPARK